MAVGVVILVVCAVAAALAGPRARDATVETDAPTGDPARPNPTAEAAR
jgi:hypothetical protein